MSRRLRFGLMCAGMALMAACDSGEDAPGDAGDSGDSGDAGATGTWGPNFFGVASDVDDSDAADDVGLGVVWDPDRIEIPFADGTCFVVHTKKADVVGQDLGPVVVRGGSGSASQALTRNDQGYYYLDGEPDPWHEGDSVSVDADGHSYGPAEIPSALAENNLASLVRATRDEDLVIEASGSSGELLGLSLAAADDEDSYMALCTSEAGSDELVVPAVALATIPAGLDMLHLKLQGANATDHSDVRLIAAGPSVETDLPLE